MSQDRHDEAGQQTPWLARAIATFDADGFKDGDMLSHLWLRHALDVPQPKSLQQAEELQWALLSRMDAFRAWLLTERKIALESVRGRGYVIVPPGRQAEFACKEAMSLVRRGLHKGDQLLQHTRLDALTEDERRRHSDAHVRLNGVKGLLTRQRREIMALFAPKKPDA